MDLLISDKRALVTGSTAGIGFAIAQAFASEGVRVTLNGRTEARTRAAVEAIRQTHPTAAVDGIAADLGTAEGVKRLVDAHPDVDILVNNVGIFAPKSFVEIDDADWQRHFDVNVMSGVRLSRHYFPRMLKQNWGRIIFISSESGVQIPVEMIQYGTTKTAQLAVSRGLAEAAAGTKVTVNAVLPGPTLSEGVGDFVETLAKNQRTERAEVEAAFFRDMRPSSLLKRFATPDEVASMVLYLASERASATSGAALRVDGGVIRAIV